MSGLNSITDTIGKFNNLLSSVEGVSSALGSLADVNSQIQKSVNGFDWF